MLSIVNIAENIAFELRKLSIHMYKTEFEIRWKVSLQSNVQFYFESRSYLDLRSIFSLVYRYPNPTIGQGI